MRVAAIQFEPLHADVRYNWSRACKILQELGPGGADVAVFPEMGLTGYLWPDAQSILPFAQECGDPQTQQQWVETSQSLQTWLLVGHPAVDGETGTLRNRCTLVSPEGIVGHYDKTCLYEADLTWAVAGSSAPPVWETPWGKVSPLICADLDYPEPIDSAVRSGAQAILFPTAWVEEPGPSATWTLRSWEHRIPIVAADMMGHEQGTVFSGGSAIISAEGDILETVDYEQGAISHSLDLNAVVTKHSHPVINFTSFPTDYVPLTPDELEVAVLTTKGQPDLMGKILNDSWPLADVCVISALLCDSTDHHQQFIESLLSSAHWSSQLVAGSSVIADSSTSITWFIHPDGTYHEVSRTPSLNTHSYDMALLKLGNVQIAITGASALETTSPVRAASVEGIHLILATGEHRLPPSRIFPGTQAGFGNGLDEPDDYFAHPVRFRAGDSNVWIASATHSPRVPGGIFSPNHIRWPRRETLSLEEGWATATVTISATDEWGIDAREKPMLNRRRSDLYPQNWTVQRTNT